MARILTILLVTLLSTPSSAQESNDTSRLSIVTFNMWHDKKDYDKRLNWAAQELGRLQPDIILLQEASFAPIHFRFKNSAKALAEKLGYQYRYHRSDGMDAVFAEGLAVLSKYPILSFKSHKLPHSAAFLLKQRWVVRAEIAHPAANVVVYDTHLETDDKYHWVRVDQILSLLQFIGENASDGPTFLAGDLNSDDISPVIKMMTGAGPGSVGKFVDTIASFHAVPPPTLSPSNPYSGVHKHSRPDYILFASSGNHKLQLRSANVILDQRSPQGVFASDHFGVFMESEIVRSYGQEGAAREELKRVGERAKGFEKLIYDRKMSTLAEVRKSTPQNPNDPNAWENEVYARFIKRLENELPGWADELIRLPMGELQGTAPPCPPQQIKQEIGKDPQTQA